MTTQLSSIVVEVNDNQVGIVANSLRFTEGLGMQTVRAVSEGNGKVSQVYSQDVEESVGKVMFSLHTTIDNIALAREWKELLNANLVVLNATDKEGNDMQRAYTQMAMLNDPEITIAADGNIEVEFSGNAPT